MYLLDYVLGCSERLDGLQQEELYEATYSRFGPWVIGVAFGYLVYEAKRKELKLSLVIQYSLTFIAQDVMAGMYTALLEQQITHFIHHFNLFSEQSLIFPQKMSTSWLLSWRFSVFSGRSVYISKKKCIKQLSLKNSVHKKGPLFRSTGKS
jgi:hypothetical protein